MSGCVGGIGRDNNVGAILVLFILLVIIACSFGFGGVGGFGGKFC
ncbi:sporulation protein YjcZ [Paenibacillus sp. GSMTC-2017]|nr:sporulation protein YjcZ [Paenibacillus sp. GSMTC-2017]MBH5320110.1 sporulation protein YjcZ [Paenibacillus sp. GSMTC-2017]